VIRLDENVHAAANDDPEKHAWQRKDFGDMPTNANPIAFKAAKGPSRGERRVLCATYQRCLDEAVKKNWDGFSCIECGAFHPLQFDLSEWVLDSFACIALINVAESQNSFKQKRRGTIVRRLQRIRSQGSVLGFG
jgi:hypothetical protein